jgi:hypothetical protein
MRQKYAFFTNGHKEPNWVHFPINDLPGDDILIPADFPDNRRSLDDKCAVLWQNSLLFGFVGIIIGPFVGAAVGEYLARRDVAPRQAGRASAPGRASSSVLS